MSGFCLLHLPFWKVQSILKLWCAFPILFWRRYNALLLWFALIKSCFALLTSLCLPTSAETQHPCFGKVEEHICKQLANSEMSLKLLPDWGMISVSSSYVIALFVFLCFVREWRILMFMKDVALLNFSEINQSRPWKRPLCKNES